MIPTMGAEAKTEAERKLEALLRAGALGPVAILALETYGAEVFGFLVNLMGATGDAEEVFAQTTEDLWRGLGSFGRRCSMRTWMYLLARHAAARYRRSPWNRADRMGDSKLDELAAVARTHTQPWRRTEVKDRLQVLRDSLDMDDHAILILRVDRDLPWEEVARVMLSDNAPDAAALSREAARLRKRFQVLKEELRKRARSAGLIDD